MNKLKNIIKKITSDETHLQNIREIILKVVLGFIIIAGLVFIAIDITHKKLSKLSKTVSAILEPNIKLAKLKEISHCLYSAETNVKAYTIQHDTAYLLSYENYVDHINIELDTLLRLSAQGVSIDLDGARNKQDFSAQIDTLRELIIARVDLFNKYIEFKTDENSRDVLLQVLKKIKINQYIEKKTQDEKALDSEEKNENRKKSFWGWLWPSTKSRKDTSDFVSAHASLDSIRRSIQKIIAQTHQEEKINKNILLSKEMDITQQESIVTNHIVHLLTSMEEKELVEGNKRIHIATEETTAKVSLISNWVTASGLILALMFLYFIYHDILRAKRFREQLLLAKINSEKRASQYSLSLIEASLDPLVTINAEGKITDMNEATVTITGMERKKLRGTDFLNYFTEPQKAREVYQEVFAKGSVADSPLTLRHKNGKLTHVLFNGSVYKDDTGNVLGVVVVARDITDQKRFENELIEAKRNAERATLKAEESNKLKEAFLSNMSHEIRTPMNAIIGFSDILSKKELGSQEKEYVKTIKSAGENLLTIINDILDISKIEAGMMLFEEKNFSIKEIFQSLHIMLMEKAKEKKIELLFTCDKNVPDVLLGDHMRLAQIIINLAGNAIKFTPKGKVQVNVKAIQKEEKSTLLEFCIQDTGIGIHQDKLDHIFERFGQAESHTTRKYGGTGLGLSIAKQLVELQGGTLSVKSELKVGSVFSFCIPYRNELQPRQVPEVAEKKYNIEELSKLKILLVEDNPLNVKLILSLFSENNFKLQAAENGNVCIKKLKENNGLTPLTSSFDIILMDMEMPGMNGYEAAAFIRKDLKSNIPIIAMTANAMAGEREKCISLGMNDYISKPINANLLFEKIYDLAFNT